jgi:hypothetical protein
MLKEEAEMNFFQKIDSRNDNIWTFFTQKNSFGIYKNSVQTGFACYKECEKSWHEKIRYNGIK